MPQRIILSWRSLPATLTIGAIRTGKRLPARSRAIAGQIAGDREEQAHRVLRLGDAIEVAHTAIDILTNLSIATMDNKLTESQPVSGSSQLLARFDTYLQSSIAPSVRDLDPDVKERINEVAEKIRELINAIDGDLGELVNRYVRKINSSPEEWSLFKLKVDKIMNDVEFFFDNNPDVSIITEFFKKKEDSFIDIWRRAAEQGWYIATVATFSAITSAVKGGDVLDEFMIKHLNRSKVDFREKIIRLYPERAEVLECVFQLHDDGKYIASIPLFFSQSDGICAQHLGTYLFSEHDKRNDIVSNIIENAERAILSAAFCALILKTQVGASISQASAPKKLCGPNRNGVMHGSRKHLDYGTELNSYKAMSLVFFVAFLLNSEDGLLKNAITLEKAKSTA